MPSCRRSVECHASTPQYQRDGDYLKSVVVDLVSTAPANNGLLDTKFHRGFFRRRFDLKIEEQKVSPPPPPPPRTSRDIIGWSGDWKETSSRTRLDSSEKHRSRESRVTQRNSLYRFHDGGMGIKDALEWKSATRSEQSMSKPSPPSADQPTRRPRTSDSPPVPAGLATRAESLVIPDAARRVSFGAIKNFRLPHFPDYNS